MNAADIAFAILAAALVGAAVVATFVADTRRGANAVYACGLTLAAMLAALGAFAAAALQAFVVLAAAALQRRADANAVESTNVPMLRDDAESPRARSLGSVALVLAFFALAAHALLIARWPLDPVSAAAGPQHVSLSHYVFVSLLLFTIGMLAIVLQRTARAAWIGVGLMSGASVLAIAAVARFVGGAGDGRLLAALVVVMSSVAPLVAIRLGSLDLDAKAAGRFANGLAGALVGITIALLTDTW
jgi:NADH-quinone oxidoreductase subunit K